MYYLTHLKVFLLSNLNTMYSLWLKFIIIILRLIKSDELACGYEMKRYSLTQKTYLFDRECCLYGNGLFINLLEDKGIINTSYWNNMRESMISSKVIFDQYYKIFNSVTGYKYILDELVKAHPEKREPLMSLYNSHHPIYTEIKTSEELLLVKRRIHTEGLCLNRNQ